MKKLLIILISGILILPCLAVAEETHYLFDSSGDWIAFREGKNVFDTEGEWIGWLAWDDADVATVEGEYLGTITNGDRLYYFSGRPYSGYPGYPGYPGFAGYSSLPSGTKDVLIIKKE